MSTSWLRFVLPTATAIVIAAIALLLLMTPLWTHFALQVAGGAYTGAGALATPQLSFNLSDRVVSELLFGPGTFSYGGHPRFFTADEAAHLRDVRLVLLSYLGVALVSAMVLAAALVRVRDRRMVWRAIGRGGSALAVLTLALAVFAATAFGIAFELFHRIVFPGGNWSFPADSALIQLYPYEFWQVTAGALALLVIVGGLSVWLLARRHASRI